MKFIDLFSGLGGFHIGLKNLGHECVFACEIDSDLRKLYHSNFGILPHGDIKQVKTSDIPEHQILCAGFPCQPFSKAGFQAGLDDIRGTLFYDIANILKTHSPEYIILENVPNFKHHDNGKTWNIVSNILERELNYDIDVRKLSPHQFNIPQIRERIFIVGAKSGLDQFSWPAPVDNNTLNIRQILDKTTENNKFLPEREFQCLTLWQKFLDLLPKSVKLPSFPIWSMEFGASYPYEEIAPAHLRKTDLDNYLGSYGQSLHGMLKRDQLERLPKYARNRQNNQQFPKWKQSFIRQNREFYFENKKLIDPILPEIQKMPPSWQKLEWNCQGEERNIFEKIIQFRGSGIRVKRSNFSPALVASTSTQIPIIGWENRYISIKEAAKLQSLYAIRMPKTETSAYKALGNAVNAHVVFLVAQCLINKRKEFENFNTTEILKQGERYSSVPCL